METSARWALFIFTLSSNWAKENISKQDGKRSGGKGSGPWRWLIAKPTGKELSCSQRSIHIYQTKPRIKTNIPVFSLCHISSSVAVSDFLSFSSRLTPDLLFRRLQTPPPGPRPLFLHAFLWSCVDLFLLAGEAHKNASDASLSWRGQRSARQLWDNMKHSSRGRSGLKNGLYVTWGGRIEAGVTHRAKPVMKPQLGFLHALDTSLQLL